MIEENFADGYTVGTALMISMAASQAAAEHCGRPGIAALRSGLLLAPDVSIALAGLGRAKPHLYRLVIQRF